MAALVALGLAALLTACADPEPPPPSWPTGQFAYGDAGVLRELLAGLAHLEGTPLQKWARALDARLAACDRFAAASPSRDLAALWSGLGCDPAPPPEHVRKALGDADFVVAGDQTPPGGHAARWLLRGRRDAAGSLSLDWILEPRPDEARASHWLLPDERAPGPPRLRGEGALIHGRFRPERGLDFASLLEDEGQADRLFRLKSRLFAGAIFAGPVEWALYMPAPGDAVPPAALALDIALPAAARVAVHGFVEELERTWPIRHSEVKVAGRAAICFEELRILPAFAPCAVQADDALYVAWNRASLALALSSGGAADPLPGEESHGGMRVDLAALPRADERLNGEAGPGDEGVRFGWQRLHIESLPRPDALQIRLSLEGVPLPLAAAGAGHGRTP